MVPHKIFNDPVYGFVTVPKGLLMELIEHPWFQRLRRIRQLGMTDFVYPGAMHTRFQHALGALHLMQSAVAVLRSKGVVITDEEAEAVQAAILLHDIGHGPFSHVLEHTLLPFHHEHLSRGIMVEMNRMLGGRLDLTIPIFRNEYDKPFLHQLVSGQLDMDRMDYLNRDSFFTGVHEGVIGYDRIVKMLHVHEGRLVVEEKGVYSIEKFLIARRLMYWQVYLHKTVLAAEQMMVMLFRRLFRFYEEGRWIPHAPQLRRLLEFPKDNSVPIAEVLPAFTRIDDVDILQEIKYLRDQEDFLLRYVATGLLDRRLFRISLDRRPLAAEKLEEIRSQLQDTFAHVTPDWDALLLTGVEESRAYQEGPDEILILKKDGSVVPYSEETEAPITERSNRKFYTIYPRMEISATP
jgi:HD superfamily phosphohydrolase